MNKVYLAGGCFWCIQDYISSFPGIKKVVSGYSGGKEKAVTYKEVKEQKTGHRETIEVNYNEEEVSLNEIIDIYLSYVDPLDKEGQFIDKGFSYTLALFYQNEVERNLFEQKIKELETKLNHEVYINVLPFSFFIEAEEYHQDYSKKNPDNFFQELVNSSRVCHLAKYKKN